MLKALEAYFQGEDKNRIAIDIMAPMHMVGGTNLGEDDFAWGLPELDPGLPELDPPPFVKSSAA